MKRRNAAIVAAFLVLDLAIVTAVSCGARTGLPFSDSDSDSTGGASSDAGVDAAKDAAKDVGPDAPIDVPNDCEDPSTTFVYLVTSENELWSYNPPTNAFALRGTLDCPSGPGSTPFSMGVDRKGTAYVVFEDGNLYKVSTKDASCEATDFVPDQLGFHVFGMGFALDSPGGLTDSLYVAEINHDGPSLGLGTIDTDSLALSFVGPFSENPGNEIEMTSASDGNLYGFFLDASTQTGTVVQIDKTDANLLSQTPVPVPSAGAALAFAFHGGDFFVFTADGRPLTTVTRYRPSDGSIGPVASLDRTVVGAGVSTCAPR